MSAPFPTDVQEFDSDDRISFSKLDNKFIAVHDDGSEYEFDADNKRWVLADEDPPEDDAHEFYGGQPSQARAAEEAPSKKRKNGSEDPAQTENSKPARPNKKQKAPPQPKQNTAVYVTGLPLDATVDEVHDVFSRKGGVIAEEIDSGAPRIKMYEDSNGNFKGDALVVFFKPQSVEMATMLLDDSDFRMTASGAREGRIRVQAADSSYKKVQHDQNGTPEGGNGAAKKEGPPQEQQKRSNKDRQKIIKKTQKLDAKLADWDDDDPYPAQQAASKWDKMVILVHMFTLAELEEDPAALLDIKEDIREECEKLGKVTNVVLFDLEPEGIVSVKFEDIAAADACITLMHGRKFDGRTVEAFLATGQEKFKKSKDKIDDEDSD